MSSSFKRKVAKKGGGGYYVSSARLISRHDSIVLAYILSLCPLSSYPKMNLRQKMSPKTLKGWQIYKQLKVRSHMEKARQPQRSFQPCLCLTLIIISEYRMHTLQRKTYTCSKPYATSMRRSRDAHPKGTACSVIHTCTRYTLQAVNRKPTYNLFIQPEVQPLFFI